MLSSRAVRANDMQEQISALRSEIARVKNSTAGIKPLNIIKNLSPFKAKFGSYWYDSQLHLVSMCPYNYNFQINTTAGAAVVYVGVLPGFSVSVQIWTSESLTPSYAAKTVVMDNLSGSEIVYFNLGAVSGLSSVTPTTAVFNYTIITTNTDGVATSSLPSFVTPTVSSS